MLHVAFSPADPGVIYFPLPIALIKLAVQREIHHKEQGQETITVQRKTVLLPLCGSESVYPVDFCISMMMYRQIRHENFASSPSSLCRCNCSASLAPSCFPPSPLFLVIPHIHLSLLPSSTSPCSRMLSHSSGVRRRLQNNSSVSGLSLVL